MPTLGQSMILTFGYTFHPFICGATDKTVLTKSTLLYGDKTVIYSAINTGYVHASSYRM